MGEEGSHSVRDAGEDDHADIPGTWRCSCLVCAGARLMVRGACGERHGHQGREDGGRFYVPWWVEGGGH